MAVAKVHVLRRDGYWYESGTERCMRLATEHELRDYLKRGGTLDSEARARVNWSEGGE